MTNKIQGKTHAIFPEVFLILFSAPTSISQSGFFFFFFFFFQVRHRAETRWHSNLHLKGRVLGRLRGLGTSCGLSGVQQLTWKWVPFLLSVCWVRFSWLWIIPPWLAAFCFARSSSSGATNSSPKQLSQYSLLTDPLGEVTAVTVATKRWGVALSQTNSRCLCFPNKRVRQSRFSFLDSERRTIFFFPTSQMVSVVLDNCYYRDSWYVWSSECVSYGMVWQPGQWPPKTMS